MVKEQAEQGREDEGHEGHVLTPSCPLPPHTLSNGLCFSEQYTKSPPVWPGPRVWASLPAST